MFGEWLAPVIEWFGLGTVGFFLLAIIIILIFTR